MIRSTLSFVAWGVWRLWCGVAAVCAAVGLGVLAVAAIVEYLFVRWPIASALAAIASILLFLRAVL